VSADPGRTALLVRQVVRFAASTLVGLVVDVGLYSAGVALGLPPGLANAISSACSVAVMYVLSTRVAFGVSSTLRGFLLFVAWYAVSITVFSVAIQLLHGHAGLPALWSKIVTLPFSFIANFTAVRLVLAPMLSTSAPVAGQSQGDDRG